MNHPVELAHGAELPRIAETNGWKSALAPVKMLC
jgi:hypothetical protein